MSGKEVRKYVQHTKDCGAHSYMARQWGVGCNCGLKEALSADPDLVALLRRVIELHSKTAEAGVTSYSAIRCETLWEMKKEIEKTVRLTDEPPGWKWVEKNE